MANDKQEEATVSVPSDVTTQRRTDTGDRTVKESRKAPPQHPFELTIRIGGNDWDYVVLAAEKVAEHISGHGEDCSLISGGGGGCHSVEIVKRNISAEDYDKELLEWMETA